MDRLGACPPSRLENSLLIQIALGRRALSDQVRLVRIGHVSRFAVDLRIHGNRSDPELPQRAEDTDRDLSTVGDQDLAEERHYPRILSA